MSKPLALLFSIAGVLVLLGIGAALSYRNLWVALLLAVFYFVVVGAGFIVKAKLRKRNNSN